MITLNSERGLVDVKNWEEVTSLVGFVSNLDPSKYTLDSVIGRYIEHDKVNCGLSNCHTAHIKGFIIKTKEGLLTNIGKDCGKNHLGVDFETMSRKLVRDISIRDMKERLATYTFQLEEIEGTLKRIRHQDKGADWVYLKSTPLITPNRGCPETVVRKLKAMIKNSSASLTLEREATAEEINLRETAMGKMVNKPFFVEDLIAEILGLEALHSENSLKNILVNDIEENLKAFNTKNIDKLDYKELSYWTKWFDELDNKFSKSEKIVKFGIELLTKNNLGPFNKILDTGEQKTFKAFLKTLD